MTPPPLLLALLLPLPSAAGPAAAAPTGRAYRLTSDLGVPADRGVNVADRISQAIDRLAPGDTLLFEGMYRVDWAVRIGGKSRITLARADGIAEAGLVRLAQPEKPDGWGFDQPRDPHLPIVGSGAVGAPHGFGVRGSQRIRIAGARVYGVHGDIMRVADDPCRIPRCLHPTGDILFEDGYGYMPGRHAFGMVEGTRITVRRTNVEMASRSGIDFEPLPHQDPGAVSDVLFEDVTLWDYVNYGIAFHNNPAYRYTFRRMNLRGGLGAARLASDARVPRIYPPHEDIVLEDFTYTNKKPNPRRDGNYWEGGFR